MGSNCGTMCSSLATGRRYPGAAFALFLVLLITHMPMLARPALAQVIATPAFQKFVAELWPEAQTLGISRATFDQAFRGVTPDLTLPDLTLPDLILPGTQRPSGAGQAEFTKTPADYINATQLARLADQGRGLLRQHAAILQSVEKQIGVDRHVVLAIWGRETAYGGYKPTHNAIRALATQAFLGRRKEMFRTELLQALKMVELKVIAPEAMKASWAGAMGLTQFMPSEYFTLARDMDGDGRTDIWGSIPDALGSAANQLKEKGWVPNLPWGFEVRAPTTATCLMEGIPQKKPVRDWFAAGSAPLQDGDDGDACRRGSVSHSAGGALWSSISRDRKLSGHQALQHLRSLCVVRRQSCRSHFGRR